MNTRATHTAFRPELARDLGRGYFDVGDFERHDHERRTRAVCERTRWLLFKAIAEVHPRLRTPAVSIVVQCALAVVGLRN